MKNRRNRLLALTLALTLLLPLLSAPAAAGTCGNGGFYVGVNAGAAWTKAKIGSVWKTQAKGRATFDDLDFVLNAVYDAATGTASYSWRPATSDRQMSWSDRQILSLLQAVVDGDLGGADGNLRTEYKFGSTALLGITAGNWMFYVPLKAKMSQYESMKGSPIIHYAGDNLSLLKITNFIENDQGIEGTFAYGPVTEGNGLTDIGRDFIRNALGNTALDDLAGQTLCGDYARQAAAEALGLSETTLSWAQLGQQVDNLLSTLDTADAAALLVSDAGSGTSDEGEADPDQTVPDRVYFDFDSSKVSLAARERLAAANRSTEQKAALQALRDKIAGFSDSGGCLTMADLQTLTRATGTVKAEGATMDLTLTTGGAQAGQTCPPGGWLTPDGECACGETPEGIVLCD